MNDRELHDHIEALVREEHELFERDRPIGAEDRARLEAINVQLDRLWDLLRQRRARAEFGQDPGLAKERAAKVVENYVE
jgi:hypothetical protein